ncbi:condensation domain-containing protein [Streptomyces sp. enrichment culture]|uniref:condensation domain-containing protein n=1 Tax=Streptomyces sp. enrichment culture TaxID=1795815 RepID=UPI003F55E909
MEGRETRVPEGGRHGNPGPGRREVPGRGRRGDPASGRRGNPTSGSRWSRSREAWPRRALAAREGAGPAMVLLAVWCPLPHAWSGEEDGVLGMPFVGRDEPGTGDAVGLFPRVLPVRTALRAARPFGGRAVAPGGGVRSWRTTGRTRRGAAGPPSRK